MQGAEKQAIAEVAAELAAAYRGTPIAPISARLGGDVNAAYAAQLLQIDARVAGGARIVGRKIGLTSLLVQRQLGVSEPDFGYLTDDMVFADHAELSFDDFRQPRIEAEIALLLERDLDFVGITVADLIAATRYVMPALEIVASRIVDWKIGIVDTVADNASAGAVVLGGPVRRLDGLDLSGCAMVMTLNDEIVSQGRGSDCLGHPLNAAAWLGRRSVELGRPLRAGEIVLTGALGPMRPVASGDRIHATIDGLGTVAATFR